MHRFIVLIKSNLSNFHFMICIFGVLRIFHNEIVQDLKAAFIKMHWLLLGPVHAQQVTKSRRKLSLSAFISHLSPLSP